MILENLRAILATAGAPADPPAAAPTCDESTRLIGKSAVLDSMGLVTLIVDVEQQLEARYGVSIILADERAMSQARSPFASVGSLADYVCSLIEEQS
jgi:acyl carrier protein